MWFSDGCDAVVKLGFVEIVAAPCSRTPGYDGELFGGHGVCVVICELDEQGGQVVSGVIVAEDVFTLSC